MSLGKKETARFSFYSRSDFNRAAAEVLRVINRDGDLQVRLARSIPFDGGVAAGTWVGRDKPLIWDGTDADRQPSLGQHLMQVRAWLSAQAGATGLQRGRPGRLKSRADAMFASILRYRWLRELRALWPWAVGLLLLALAGQLALTSPRTSVNLDSIGSLRALPDRRLR